MAQENLGFTSSTMDIPLGTTQSTERTAASETISNGVSRNPMKDLETDDYDPHDHQQVEHPTTNTDTFFHLLKGCFGTGILAMPEAFKLAGYVMGTIGTAVIGFITTLAVHMLIESEYELSRRRRVPTLTYPETGIAALQDGPAKTRWLSKYMKTFINIFLLSNQMGCCIAYINFIASNIKAIVENYCPPLHLRFYMAFVTIPLILLNWVRDLKYLAPFSTAATSATLASFAIILYYVFRSIPSVDDKIALGSIVNFPLFFGTAMFSLEAMGVMIPLKNEMRTPSAFGGRFGVLNRAMFPIVVLFICLGLFGYLQYGNEVQATITLNLPPSDILAQLVRVLMALAIFVSHGLQNYTSFDTIWLQWLRPRCEEKKIPGGRQLLYEYLVRTAIVLFHFTLGAIFTNLGLVISLVGAFCLSMIGLTIPGIIHLATFWFSCKSRREFIGMLCKDVFFIVLGFVALVIGTYVSMRDIIADLQKS